MIQVALQEEAKFATGLAMANTTVEVAGKVAKEGAWKGAEDVSGRCGKIDPQISLKGR